MYKIVVTELCNVNSATAMPDGDSEEVERYRQTVDVLDLPKLIDVINAKPRKPRERKPRMPA